MRVDPRPGDSPEEITLMTEIDAVWQNMVLLRRAAEAEEKQHGLLRAKLRLLHEGLVEGEILLIGLKKQSGRLEVSADIPYLWLRLLDQSGNPAKRRLQIGESEIIARPDGTVPVLLHDSPMPYRKPVGPAPAARTA